MSSLLFDELTLVHELPGRLRYRYRTTTKEFDEFDLTEQLALDVRLRLNRRACSLVLEYSREETSRMELEGRLRALVPSARAQAKGGGEAPVGKIGFGLWSSGVALLLGPLMPMRLRALWTIASSLPLLEGAFEDLKELRLGSHGLEAAAVGISLYRRDFGAASAAAFMIALGEHIEESISKRSDSMLKRLLRPAADQVWVIREDVEVAVEIDQVREGETVLVGAGSVVPVDGTVLSGLATVNEATMTGESVAVEKSRGTRVLSGTIVEEGQLRIYAEHVGSATLAARIAGYVEEALTEKSEIQLGASRLADRAVPLVLGLSGAAYLVSRDPDRAASVLQADFSCAIKLSTPVALKATMSAAGQSSILFKGAVALEALADADTFVFDKTGTLTTGRLEVTDVLVFSEEFSSTSLVGLAASVEEHYFHPLAQAVVEAAHRLDTPHFEHSEVDFVVSHGVASQISGKRVVVGSRHFVEDDERISIGDHRQRIEELELAGKTLLYIGFGGQLAGVIALRDRVRDNARLTIERLRQEGVKRILMLTGDRRERAEELARALGLDEFHAELLPDHKSKLVEELSRSGHRLAFVGDGINDAPALAKAAVGISMQRGADVARLTSDIALLADDLSKVADAKAYANAGLRAVKSNQRTAITINTSILALATLGFLSPVATAALHNGTTIWLLGRALSGGRRHPDWSGG